MTCGEQPQREWQHSASLVSIVGHAIKAHGLDQEILERRFVDRRYSARGAQSATTERGPAGYELPVRVGASCHGTMSFGESSDVSIQRRHARPPSGAGS